MQEYNVFYENIWYEYDIIIIMILYHEKKRCDIVLMWQGMIMIKTICYYYENIWYG